MTTVTVNPTGGVQTVRRVITYTLLFVLVVIAAIGLSGLLARLLDAGNPLIADDSSGLAQALAFTLIAGPLAAVLWWLVWRGLADDRDRSSVAWGLYLALASIVALIVAVTSLVSAGAAATAGRWMPAELATGLVWAGVWVWHHWMLRHPAKRSVRLVGVAATVGWLFGLAVGVGGAVAALGALVTAVTDTVGGSLVFGAPWWQGVVQSLVWTIGGAVAWRWYWEHEGARSLDTGFARVVLVIVTGFGATALCLAGVGVALHVALRLAFDSDVPLMERLDPLGAAVSAALIGALVWQYHRVVVARRGMPVRQATRLVTSGVALAGAASGVGVIVNAVLAAIGEPLADTGLRALLLGGVSAMLVGAPAWWLHWKPLSQNRENPTTGRRVYLVAVFGISALVALVTLILIAFRLFEFGLTDISAQSVLDRVRAPLGLLTATALVAGYHFAIWRRDRPAGEPAAGRSTVSRVILVAGSDTETLRNWLEETVGASVTVWTRADNSGHSVTPEQLETALDGVGSRRALVLVGPADRLEVVPLAE